MNSELKELYDKYQLSTASLFDEDSPFSTLLSSFEGGHNEYSLFSRRLEKIIDLRWVDEIEKCIIPLDTIVRNPRRFIVQEEEIVPIERAKKISSESIRHLAQHTDMIQTVKDGMVTPNRILNVFREESFDIYENRFIYTLLINTKNFIEKRYNVIFKLSGEENINVLQMNSKAKIGKEEVNFSIRLDSKKTADSLDMDEGSDVLLRIERMRRIIDEFLSSAFASELHGCALVRPPITRTNLITKDPNFKACLDLWIFIESYTEVGYEINLVEKNEPVSQDYIDELNRLLVFNYTLLKNKIDDEFDFSKVRTRRKLKPKFIKNFIEELVNDYDVTDDEIRRIFIDQISKFSNKRKAQEDKIDAAIARCLEIENARKAAIIAKQREEERRRAEIEQRRLERERIARERAEERARKAEERRIAREKAAKEKAEALEKARIAREKARAKAQKEKAIALEKAKAARQRQLERERIAREKAKALEAERIAREKARAKAKAEKEKAEALERERIAKEKAKAKADKEKAIALEKERLAREKQKAKEKADREKAKALEAERLAREKAKAKAKAEKEKAAALEKERLAKEKAKAKAKADREKAIALEKARIAKEKEKARIKAAKEKAEALEKARIAKEKAKAKEKALKAKQNASKKA